MQFKRTTKAFAALALSLALSGVFCGTAFAGEVGTSSNGESTDLATTQPSSHDTAPSVYMNWINKVYTISGSTRYETAALEAKAAFPNYSRYVIIASGVSPMDALSATGLAGALDCPILLTPQAKLDAHTISALKSLAPAHAVIVGGTAVISPAVETELSQYVGDVHRVAGENRYQTQLRLYEFGESLGVWNRSNQVILASGDNGHISDALSVSSLAYACKAPVFVVDPAGMLPTDSKKALLASTNLDQAIIAGGLTVVSDETFGFMQLVTLRNGGAEDVVRLAGDTRYETSAIIAEWATSNDYLDWNGAAFTTGKAPYDALAGAALQGKRHSVLLLLDEGGSDATLTALAANKVIFITFFGGEAVFSDSFKQACAQACGFEDYYFGPYGGYSWD